MIATEEAAAPALIFDPDIGRSRGETLREWVLKWIKRTEGKNFSDVDQEPSATADATQTTLLRILYTDPNFGPGWSILSKHEAAEVSLMHILNKTKGCPLYVYDKVIAWAKEHCQSELSIHEDDNIIPLLRSRQQVLDHVALWSHGACIAPQTKTRFCRQSSESALFPNHLTLAKKIDSF